MKRGFQTVSALLVCLALGSCAEKPMVMLPAPEPLAHVSPTHEEAEFWVSRLPDADRVILETKEIQHFNALALQGDTNLVDIFAYPDPLDASVVQDITGDLKALKIKPPGYDHTNRPLTPSFYSRIEDAIGFYPETISPEYGIIVTRTDLRRLPTTETFRDKPSGNGFDRFQYSLLEPGTPAAIFHYTKKRDWCLVRVSHTMGWVASAHIATGRKEDVQRFARSNPLVVTGDRVEIYFDESFRHYATSLQMGASLPFTGRIETGYEVILPQRDAGGRLQSVRGFVRADADVSEGFLPFTMRNVYGQAFKMLNIRYGWGDMYEGRDCSRFVMDTFRCFGFDMPRNSLRQSKVNAASRVETGHLSEEEKIDLLKRYDGRPTLLYMPGHIMLFLGVPLNRPYIIHSAWAYVDSTLLTNETHYIGRVVVSDTSLGQGGKSGSLLRRITAVTALD